MRTPAKIGLGALTFAVVCVGFVLTMRSCARAIWPTQIATIATDFRTLTIRMEELRCR